VSEQLPDETTTPCSIKCYEHIEQNITSININDSKLFLVSSLQVAHHKVLNAPNKPGLPTHSAGFSITTGQAQAIGLIPKEFFFFHIYNASKYTTAVVLTETK